MKFSLDGVDECGVWSLSLRRAWIEICNGDDHVAYEAGRSPYGERGLKFQR